MSMQPSTLPNRKPLGVFALVMINVIAVDNLRSLTAGAEYGLALLFFYAIAALFFFIPTILVTAELATAWPNTGGVYIWVREAFGSRLGFLAIWLQWIYNVVWYPTIFTFIAGILAYLIDPALLTHKTYMLSVILISFWSMTLLNCLGLTVSHWISTFSALIGTILPMVFIALLGFSWLYLGRPTALHLSVRHLFPNLTTLDNLAFLTNILFGLMGMEMSAVHAGDVSNPQKNYPLALFFSTVIILLTLVSACLAISIVIPANQLNLVSGLMDAFSIFFTAYHLQWCIPLLAFCIILGSLGGAATWIVGPARGLHIASNDIALPAFLTQLNKKKMPVGILLTQGIIVSLLCLLFLIMPSVNSSYWILSNLTAQLALLFYLFMFAAAIRLRYKHPQTKRAFKIPGGKIGMWIVAGAGMISCGGAIILGFLPPSQLAIGNVRIYEMILIIGIIACCLPPFILFSKKTIRKI